MNEVVNGIRGGSIDRSDGLEDVIEEGVKRVIIDIMRLDMNPADITRETDIFELGADSMITVELIFGLEERFSIHFEEEELKASMLRSVGKMTDLVAGKFRAE